VSIGMHPNTETASRILFANEMMNFLLDILPLDADGGDDKDDGDEKQGGGLNEISLQISDRIKEKIQLDRFADLPGIM